MNKRTQWLIGVAAMVSAAAAAVVGRRLARKVLGPPFPKGVPRGERAAGDLRDITPIEAQKKRLEGSATLVHVGTGFEYSREHIPGSLHIAMDSLADAVRQGRLDKNETFILYCADAYRSKRAGQWLIANGFPRVFHMSGGMSEWRKTGLPTAA